MSATSPHPPPANHTLPTRQELSTVGWYVAAYCAVVLLVNVAHGTEGIPRNDDWAAYANTFEFAEQSRFVLNGWLQMFFLGQAVLARPFVEVFGESMFVLQVLVLVLAGAGLWLAHFLLRMFVSQRIAFFAVATLALGPVYGSIGFGFGTDVPAFAFQMASLVAGWHATRHGAIRWPWLLASLGLATWGFCIREYSVVAGLAVISVAARQAWTARRSSGDGFARVMALGGAWLGLLVWLFVWRGRLPHTSNAGLTLSVDGIGDSLPTVWSAALTLGVFVLPAALLVSPVRLARIAIRDCPRTTVALVAAEALFLGLRPELLGNFFTSSGSYPETLGGSAPVLLPGWTWELVPVGAAYGLAVGSVTCAVLAVRGGRRWIAALARPAVDDSGHARDLVLAFVGFFVLVNTAVMLGTDTPYLDRYLVALIPFVAGLLMHGAHRLDATVESPGRTGALALGVTAMVGTLFVTNSAAFDGARWRLAERVEARGYAASTIDGGFEWFSHHQTDKVVITPAPFDPTPMQGGFWRWIFTPRPVCVTILRGDTPEEASGNENPPLIDSLEVDPILGPSYRLYAFAGPTGCTPSPGPTRG